MLFLINSTLGQSIHTVLTIKLQRVKHTVFVVLLGFFSGLINLYLLVNVLWLYDIQQPNTSNIFIL